MNAKEKGHLTTPEMFAKIESSLLSFCNITKLPVTFYDKNGVVKNEYNSQMKICKFLDIYNQEGGVCRRNLVSSIQTASTLGEPYIFVCSSGFIKIAITLMVKGEILGCFMVGPLIMEKLTQRNISRVIQLNSNMEVSGGGTNAFDNSASISRILILLKDMKVFTTKEVTSLSNLLSDCIVANLADSTDYSNVRKKSKEQTQVGIALQDSKKNNRDISYPLDLEHKLIQSIQRGDLLESQNLMMEIFQSILLLGAGNIEFIKIRLIELSTVLSRSVLLSGDLPGSAISINADYNNEINTIDTISGLESWSGQLAGDLARHAGAVHAAKSPVIREVLRDIHEDFSSRLNLAELASRHHINASYLSVCFKREVGESFSDYLNSVRIKKSKELLEKTTLRIIDVAIASGFEDQSYFTKVFRQDAGCTPSQYRKQLSLISSGI